MDRRIYLIIPLFLLLLSCTACQHITLPDGTADSGTISGEYLTDTSAPETAPPQTEESAPLPTEGRTTEAPEPITEPDTEVPTEPEPTTEDIGDRYFVYDLGDWENSYYEVQPDFKYSGEDRAILLEDGVYVIRGKNGIIYGRGTILTSDQKALLDAGYVMKVVYGEEVLDHIRARVIEEEYLGDWMEIPYIIYVGNNIASGYAQPILSPDYTQYAYDGAGIDLDAPPYNGLGYWIHLKNSIPAYDWNFHSTQKEVRLELPADLMIELGLSKYDTQKISVEEFYRQNYSFEGFGLKFRIYEKDGEIVRIIAVATS